MFVKISKYCDMDYYYLLEFYMLPSISWSFQKLSYHLYLFWIIWVLLLIYDCHFHRHHDKWKGPLDKKAKAHLCLQRPVSIQYQSKSQRFWSQHRATRIDDTGAIAFPLFCGQKLLRKAYKQTQTTQTAHLTRQTYGKKVQCGKM